MIKKIFFINPNLLKEQAGFELLKDFAATNPEIVEFSTIVGVSEGVLVIDTPEKCPYTFRLQLSKGYWMVTLDSLKKFLDFKEE